jgi:hypothetical protein
MGMYCVRFHTVLHRNRSVKIGEKYVFRPLGIRRRPSQRTHFEDLIPDCNLYRGRSEQKRIIYVGKQNSGTLLRKGNSPSHFNVRLSTPLAQKPGRRFATPVCNNTRTSSHCAMGALRPKKIQQLRHELFSITRAARAGQTPSCLQCWFRQLHRASAAPRLAPQLSKTVISVRAFSHSSRARQDPREPILSDPVTKAQTERPSITQNDGETTIHEVADETLPSHHEKQRWSLSKRTHKIMDDLMPRLALASQRINNYTGTDYSGIAALRQEIKDQGKLGSASAYSVI